MNHRITDAEADDIAAYFRATLGDAPPLHPMRSHLPTRDEALSIAAKHYAISCVSKDAAREAAFGTDIEREQRLTEPDGDDRCPRCSGDGWIENGDGYDQCTCGEAV